jgi:hypothetical protein
MDRSEVVPFSGNSIRPVANISATADACPYRQGNIDFLLTTKIQPPESIFLEKPYGDFNE